MRNFIKFSVVLLVIGMTMSSCGCFKSCRTKSEQESPSDSTMIKILGDSISAIVLKPDKVTVSDSNDGITVAENRIYKLKPTEVSTFLFLLENKANFKTDKIVYGKFTPSVTYEFKRKKDSVSISFDFGLGKYTIVDSKGTTLAKYDLANNELTRFTYRIFPSDRLLQILNQQK